MAYACPMHPEVKSESEGKCPKCGMDLVPAGTERVHHHEEKASYVPLIVVLGAIAAVTVILQLVGGGFDGVKAMRHFMGLFFMTFGAFKLLDLRGFVGMFADYDIVAKRFPEYGYAYPFIELTLGAAYLTNTGGKLLHALTLAIMAVGSIGIARALSQKRKIRCACLGAVVKLPMSTVTLIEDVGMGLMALLMLVL